MANPPSLGVPPHPIFLALISAGFIPNKPLPGAGRNDKSPIIAWHGPAYLVLMHLPFPPGSDALLHPCPSARFQELDAMTNPPSSGYPPLTLLPGSNGCSVRALQAASRSWTPPRTTRSSSSKVRSGRGRRHVPGGCREPRPPASYRSHRGLCSVCKQGPVIL